ncbi:MAG: crossover junction endodeoxyribonuclease RuvC [Abditibacteriota bacterium]|nr:crossover junction endodeoxyribonuclease RuvC [Abditibacteriota bacterium]
MRILGIDPGTAIIGYGVIDCTGGRRTFVECGVITTPKTKSTPDRLMDIYSDINTIISEYEPDETAIERLFFNHNVTTAIDVAKASGVLNLAIAQRGLPIREYTPVEVKTAVTGYGGADKKQVQYMITRILDLKSVPKPDDAADALAVALCHSQASRLKGI